MIRAPSTPLVSVLMPVYNGQKYLQAAIDSILGQTLASLELIIVDDGSTDGTAGILSAVSDRRVRVLSNGNNKGVAISLNLALNTARGRYVSRMDADDVAMSRRLEKQVGFLEKQCDISLLGTGVHCTGLSHGRVRYWKNHAHIQAQCLFNSPFAHPTVCWRRESFETHQLRYQEDPPTAEDFELWERACGLVRAANLPEPLLHYRIDPTVKVSAYLRQQLAGGRMVRERLLDRAGFALDASSLELLHQIGEGSFPLAKETLWEAANLFKVLRHQQDAKPWFEKRALQEVTSRQLRWLLVRHGGCMAGKDLLGLGIRMFQSRLLLRGDFMRWLVQLARTKPSNTAGIPSSL
jgi:hypothetical protein